MIIDPSGKTAVVTGSTAGIGFAASPQASATTGDALRAEGGIVESIA
jgi:NAD(P)-dependent dehydrogenase (short-subunit alcohol dehydrogenase family)